MGISVVSTFSWLYNQSPELFILQNRTLPVSNPFYFYILYKNEKKLFKGIDLG